MSTAFSQRMRIYNYITFKLVSDLAHFNVALLGAGQCVSALLQVHFQFANLLSSRFFSPLPFFLCFHFDLSSPLTTKSSNQHHMSDKMRRYMPVIAFWILVILSAFHFALAAPVAVREVLEVRSNAVGVLKDGIAAWEKRMDSGDEGQWSTNEPGLSPFKAGSSAFEPGRSAFKAGASAVKAGSAAVDPGPSAVKPGSA